VLRRYMDEILSPESPIYTGLSRLTARLTQSLNEETK
jgi:hypothetical protein